VYQRIGGLTDCGAVTQQFEVASGNHDRAVAADDDQQRKITLSYMKAAQDRLTALHCP
jgi:hypothetical protein